VLERSVARRAELLKPPHTALREEVLSQNIVFTDDTTVRIAQAGQPGSSKKGRLWIYTDKRSRPFYDCTESQGRAGPELVFRGFRGYVQADAHSVYDKLCLLDDVTEVACWAHTRRKFEVAETSDPELSAKALDLIGKVAVGRKNWLFVQTERGGKTASVMMSLIQTAEAAGVNGKLYLRDVLQRIATESEVKKLLPHGWKENFEAEATGRRNEILELLIVDQGDK